MIYLEINDKTTEAKKILAFLKTQSYTRILDTPNETTKTAIKEARSGKTIKASIASKLFKDILG